MAAVAPSGPKARARMAALAWTPQPLPRASGASHDAESTVRSRGKSSPSRVWLPTRSSPCLTANGRAHDSGRQVPMLRQ